MRENENTNVGFQKNNKVFGLLIIFMLIISLGQGYCVLQLYEHEPLGKGEAFPEGYQEMPEPIEPALLMGTDADHWNPQADSQALCLRIEKIFDESFYKFEVASSEDIDELHGDIQGLLDEYQYKIPTAQLIKSGAPSNTLAADFDIIENQDTYLVIIDLPGNSLNDIAIGIEGRVITIEQLNNQRYFTPVAKNYLVRQRKSGFFKKTMELPQSVKAGTLEAQFDHGVLYLSLVKQSRE